MNLESPLFVNLDIDTPAFHFWYVLPIGFACLGPQRKKGKIHKRPWMCLNSSQWSIWALLRENRYASQTQKCDAHPRQQRFRRFSSGYFGPSCDACVSPKYSQQSISAILCVDGWYWNAKMIQIVERKPQQQKCRFQRARESLCKTDGFLVQLWKCRFSYWKSDIFELQKKLPGLGSPSIIFNRKN